MATLKEALRRVYHELVHRRARVRISAPALATSAGPPPIFVLGVYGSGTTLLRYVLDSHSRICCPPESDFLSPLAHLAADARSLQGLDAMGFDEEHLLLKLRELALYFYSGYAASWDKPRWADKTPVYVDHADFLLRLFPDAQFIHIHRHGLDQAHSFTRGGTHSRRVLTGYERPGEDPRLGCLRYWSEKIERLLAFQEEHPERCFRLGYEALCKDPEGQLRPLFEFLGEDWEPEVLEFHTRPHDKGNEHGRVLATRGFEASRDHFHDWPPELLAAAAPIAEPMLERLGYPVISGQHQPLRWPIR